MSLLTNRPKNEIDGAPIYPDFRNMIEFDVALNRNDLSQNDAIRFGLWLLFGDKRPQWSAEKTVKELIGFYLRTNVQTEGKKSARGLDFEQDGDIIFSMFMQQYGINLNTIRFLHWFEFMALLESLPSECRLMQIIYCRTADISKLSKNERKRVLEMRRLYEIKNDKTIDSLEAKRERVKAMLAKGGEVSGI